MYYKFLILLFALLNSILISNNCLAEYQVEITTLDNRLLLYKNGELEKTYSVATGKKETKTPEGTFTLGVIINLPGWKHIPGGAPNNPLGPKWIGLVVNGDKARTYGIHGTNKPKSIGKSVTNGCIRMKNDEVVQLSQVISEGIPVWIHLGPSNKMWSGEASAGITKIHQKGRLKEITSTLFSGPTKGALVKENMIIGTDVEVTGSVEDWYQIRYNNIIGFMPKLHVKLVPPSEAITSPLVKQENKKVIVSVDLGNIRLKPFLQAPVLQRVRKDMQIHYIKKTNNEWYTIRLSNGTIAYIHQSVAIILTDT